MQYKFDVGIDLTLTPSPVKGEGGVFRGGQSPPLTLYPSLGLREG
jgi:hypothetical protein